ncbi:MAG TPA: NAD(P)/FAD-dependent oxidoreductase [Caproicibacter sp.]|nr:NAD(P)/FAD-dependent oxidoreductase [Caproicibacter sp.]
MFDSVIIGTGPAGLSAALTLKLHQKSIAWFGNRQMSDKIRKAELVLNYPGVPAVTGAELANRFSTQAEKMELEITEKMVNSVMRMKNHYYLMAENELVEAKTVILATGVTNMAAFPGEAELLGSGVSYCATCDGTLYRGKTIAIVSTSPRFAHDVDYLADLAGKVYFFPDYKTEQSLKENVEQVRQGIVAVLGEKRVSALQLKDSRELPVDGIFCLRDAIAPTTLLPELALEKGHIVVNRQMETNLTGCFAAGDCTGTPYQFAKAAGEGNVAAHSAVRYLAEAEKE